MYDRAWLRHGGVGATLAWERKQPALWRGSALSPPAQAQETQTNHQRLLQDGSLIERMEIAFF